MPSLIPIVALLALAASPQGPDPAAVAPFVGEDVLAVAHVDLSRWPTSAAAGKLLGKVADDPDVAEVVAALDARVAALKRAGAADLFLIFDPSFLPGYPTAVVPLAAGVDAKAVAEALAGGSPAWWPRAETIRGAVVAGSPEAVASIREAKAPGTRPELAESLASAGDAAVRMAILPTIAQRRAVEESFAKLPAPLGGGPIEAVTRGPRWASVAIATAPKATLRVSLRARDADSAAALGRVARDGLAWLAAGLGRPDPATADLADAVSRLKPETAGDRIRLEADLDASTALVAVPIFRARDLARRRECVDHLKSLGLALHNYHATHSAFPAAYVAGKDGKPLLSWRVQVLPFLGERELYDRFRQDEPWDGPHNKPLIGRMPKVFACPAASRAGVAEGKTTYLTPRGPATLFPGAVGVKIQDVLDGTSNTLLVVDADDASAVTWTRPDDWEVDRENSIEALFGHHPLGTNVTFGDGSVRFLRKTIARAVFKYMTTRAGGEAVDASSF